MSSSVIWISMLMRSEVCGLGWDCRSKVVCGSRDGVEKERDVLISCRESWCMPQPELLARTTFTLRIAATCAQCGAQWVSTTRPHGLCDTTLAALSATRTLTDVQQTSEHRCSGVGCWHSAPATGLGDLCHGHGSRVAGVFQVQALLIIGSCMNSNSYQLPP